MDEQSAGGRVVRKARPPLQVLHRVGGNGLPGFDFDGDEPTAQVDQRIDLSASRIAPKVDRRLAAAIGETLDEFRDDERLEDRSPQRMARQRVGIGDVEEVADQPGVQEVQARSFAQALAEVGVVRRQRNSQIPDLEDIEPPASGLLAHADIARQPAQV